MAIQERPLAPETTGIDRLQGKALIGFFLVFLAIPMLVQPVYEMTVLHAEELATEEAERDKERARQIDAGLEVVEDELPQIGSRFSRLQELDIFKSFPTLAGIKKYEDAIAEESHVAVLARPYTQLTVLSAIQQGNEKIMVGKDGWLFFRPGVYYVAGFPFRSHYVKNDAKVTAWDPGPAILDFHRQLEEQGVELVMLPIPVKAQIYPEKLTGRYDLACGPPANIYTDEFFDELRGEGITVIDLSRDLWDAKDEGQLYLTLDTHWTPLGMKTAVKTLAELLVARFRPILEKIPESNVEYQTRDTEVKRHGDNFYQLDLPRWSKAYPEYEVTIEQVLDASTGQPISRVNPDAEIVLLGDSFTNIYSTQEPNDDGMRWGEGAGFGEHLMRELKRAIQVIAVNGGAPTATRRQLARKGGVLGKKLLIWSFATRELITPNTEWEFVKIESAKKDSTQESAAASGPAEVIARIKIASAPPVPGADPYKEAVTLTLYEVLEVVSGNLEEEEIIGVEWVMRDLKLTKAAEYKAGDVHRLRMIPYAQMEEENPDMAQVKALDDTEAYATPSFWVQRASPAEAP